MRVCVIRNAEARTNAGMLRIVDTLTEGGYEPVLLSRSRHTKTFSAKIMAKPLAFNTSSVENHEIQLADVAGRGLNNIFHLVIYQVRVFFWLLFHARRFGAIHAFDLDAGFPALLAAKFYRTPLIYHIADFYIDSRPGIPSKLKGFVRALEFFVIARAKATIICTEERAEQIKGSHPQKLLVIHNSPIVQTEAQGAPGHKQEGCLRLCYVGSLEEKRFIKSAVEVVSRNPRVKLTIAGMDTLQEFVRAAAEEFPNIDYLGRVSYYDALQLYSACDLMFAVYDPSIPNHRYSAPNKVYEAMMLGKPIIVAKNTGFDKLMEQEKIGLCIEYTKGGFQQALDYFLDNPEKIQEMGRRAKLVYAKYSWPAMKIRLLEAYAEISGKE